MKRRLLNLLTALSLLLCAAVVVTWVRSYFAEDRLRLTRGESGTARGVVVDELVNSIGTVAYIRQTFGRKWIDRVRGSEYDRSFEPGVMTYSLPLSSQLRFVDRTEGSFAGFFVRRSDEDLGQVLGGLPTTEVWVPHWFLAGLTAPSPLVWLYSRMRSCRRSRSGLCPSCGYDLRASPGRCPECGESGRSG
jgi:hypothetical protein